MRNYAPADHESWGEEVSRRDLSFAYLYINLRSYVQSVRIGRRNTGQHDLPYENMFRLLLFSVVVVFLVEANEAASQCMCTGGTPANGYRGAGEYETAYDEYQAATLVLVGEVEARTAGEASPESNTSTRRGYDVTFRVIEAWKGDMSTFVTVRTGEYGCLIGFQKGERYLVYGMVADGILKAYYCSRTRLLHNAASDLDELERRDIRPD